MTEMQLWNSLHVILGDDFQKHYDAMPTPAGLCKAAAYKCFVDNIPEDEHTARVTEACIMDEEKWIRFDQKEVR